MLLSDAIRADYERFRALAPIGSRLTLRCAGFEDTVYVVAAADPGAYPGETTLLCVKQPRYEYVATELETSVSWLNHCDS